MRTVENESAARPSVAAESSAVAVLGVGAVELLLDLLKPGIQLCVVRLDLVEPVGVVIDRDTKRRNAAFQAREVALDIGVGALKFTSHADKGICQRANIFIGARLFFVNFFQLHKNKIRLFVGHARNCAMQLLRITIANEGLT